MSTAGLSPSSAAGGKTTLLRRLSERLNGTVILTTSIHMYSFAGVPLVDAGSEASPENRRRVSQKLRAALRDSRVIGLGRLQASGKLADPSASGFDPAAHFAP